MTSLTGRLLGSGLLETAWVLMLALVDAAATPGEQRRASWRA
ncbi:hypothetical protein [Streptacidiphilus sp. PAMC 29251]